MASENTKLLIYSIAGPSGIGKSTTVRILMNELLPDTFRFSVSATDRQPRTVPIEEKDGIHYHFLSSEEFKKLEDEGQFVETNPYATGSRYGTLVSELDKAQAEGKVLLLDIEINGAINIHKKYGKSSSLVFFDGSMDVIEHRLRNRGSETEEKILRRLEDAKAQKDKVQSCRDCFDLIIDTSIMSPMQVAEAIRDHFLLQKEQCE
jgi:guanylate kinase